MVRTPMVRIVLSHLHRSTCEKKIPLTEFQRRMTLLITKHDSAQTGMSHGWQRAKAS